MFFATDDGEKWKVQKVSDVWTSSEYIQDKAKLSLQYRWKYQTTSVVERFFSFYIFLDVQYEVSQA